VVRVCQARQGWERVLLTHVPSAAKSACVITSGVPDVVRCVGLGDLSTAAVLGRNEVMQCTLSWFDGPQWDFLGNTQQGLAIGKVMRRRRAVLFLLELVSEASARPS
jgi:hypothetical protein